MLYHIKNLVKTRQREKGYKLLIRNLSLPAGAKYALLGPSGCGKSTTLDILGLGLAPDSAAAFELHPPGKDVLFPLELWEKHKFDKLADLRLHCMGFVLQSGELLPFLNVGQNICLVAELAGMSSRKAKEFGMTLAQRLGIGHLWKAMPNTLSVGERQRAAICRALTPQPPIIVADEPTAALDPGSAENVMAIFLDCLEDFGSALILATHNAAWAASGGLTEVHFILEKDEQGHTTAIIDDQLHETVEEE